MKINTVVLFAIIMPLAGCAGLNYAVENYADVEVQRVKFEGEIYRIFDKPTEERLMITPSLGASAGQGLVQGATLGLSGPMGGPEGKYQVAAQSFLDAQPDDCTITNGGLVVQPQWEFFYDCS